MNRDDVLDTLRAHKQVLEERFDVVALVLFGSFARDQATDESDIDIYLGIDDDVIWDIVQTDVPTLLPKLRRLVDSAE